MTNRPIPVEQANAMISEYISYMEKLGVDMAKQTQSVSFTSKEFYTWLTSVMQYMDELRVCIGVYPDGTSSGRITTILWPYKDGKPARKPKVEGKGGGDDDEDVEPYNDGHTTP